MPTKSKPKPPSADHLDGARSALCPKGFSAAHDGRAYVIASGRRLTPDHPLVLAHADRFQPSGEQADAAPKGRDLNPPPRPVLAATVIRYRSVCAEGCGWEVERDTEHAAVSTPHFHAPS